MSFVAVAVGGAALAGSIYSSNKASSASKQASRSAAASEAAKLNFAKEQYKDWMDAFGDIRNNLSNYYETLTPARLETQQLQAFEEEKAAALELLDTQLAQRGITSSGIAEQAYTDIALKSAKERATIRTEAPIKTEQTRREFLQIGMGQNPANNIYGALSDSAANKNAIAGSAAVAAGQAQGKLVDSSFSLLETLLTTDYGSPTSTTTPAATPQTYSV